MAKAWPALDIQIGRPDAAPSALAPGRDPQLEELVLAELDDFQPTAVQDSEDEPRLRVFFGTAGARDSAARALAASFPDHLLVEAVDVDDEDWAARSQAALGAVTVGRIIVAPPWEKRLPEDFASLFSVFIQPSMGFGTGHHATTRLALKALQEIAVEGRSVLDIGCGSGVLAIAAAALGARSALGVDIDPDAIANANENAGLNDAADRVRFEAGDFRERVDRADIAIANLTGAVIERSAAKLAESVRPGGHLIVSGFMANEERAVVPALERLLVLDRTDSEDEWLCCTLHS